MKLLILKTEQMSEDEKNKFFEAVAEYIYSGKAIALPAGVETKLVTPPKYTWHQLDEGRGYCSCHIGEGFDLQVLTTPACDSEEEARRLMDEKVKGLMDEI